MTATHHHIIGPFPNRGCPWCTMKTPVVEEIVVELKRIQKLLVVSELADEQRARKRKL